jgi:predicted metalloprotease
MKVFRRLIVPLILAVVMMTIGCAPSLLADVTKKCALGQVVVGDKCQNYTELSDMHEFAKRIIDSLDDFADTHDLPAPTQDHLQFITSANGDISPCAPSPSEPYVTCYDDGDLYVGSAMLFKNYMENGILAPTTIVAHEYGHYVQDKANVGDQDPRPGDPANVRQEDQADCVSGAYMAWLSTKQRIKLAELTSLLGMIWQYGSNPYAEPYKTHGTPMERTKAFTTGYDDGLKACNSIGNGTITK